MSGKDAIKEQKVAAIDNGTVIDHIPADKTFVVANVLDLEGVDNIISVSTNLDSKRFGKKGIIKVGSKELTEEETNKIALFAPHASINIIKDYRVVEKRKVRLPDTISEIMKCFNPRCVTNHEGVATKFHLDSKDPLKVRCHYCERVMDSEHIVLL